MNLVSISFSSKYIFCIFLCKPKDEEITSKSLKSINITFDISLLEDPKNMIHDVIRINKQNIEFYPEKKIFTSFELRDLPQSEQCQITLKNIDFILQNTDKVKFQINRIFSFSELYDNHSDLVAQKKRLQGVRQVIRSPQESKSSHKEEITPSSPQIGSILVDSYNHFKAQIEESDLLNKSSLKFNLKDFGMKILCKLLLLMKYVNTLVDNKFQEDLGQFLKSQILNEHMVEAVMS